MNKFYHGEHAIIEDLASDDDRALFCECVRPQNLNTLLCTGTSMTLTFPDKINVTRYVQEAPVENHVTCYLGLCF
jgi:hypothetical protein